MPALKTGAFYRELASAGNPLVAHERLSLSPPKPQKQVYTEEAGDDSRYSFIPGRAADDDRLNRSHWRVLAFLGRKNANYGWWLLNQGSWSSRLRMSRQTLSTSVSELVCWQYLEQRSRPGGECWYRVGDFDPGAKAEEGGLSPAGDNQGCRPEATGLSAQPDTGVGSIEQPCILGTRATLDQETRRPSPSIPRRGRGMREDLLLDEVRSAKPHCARAFEKLLTPLLTRLPLNAPKPSDALGALAELAQQETDEVLNRALLALITPGDPAYREYDVRPTNVENAIAAAAKNVRNLLARDRGPLLWRGTQAFEDAIAKVRAVQPGWAWDLSQRPNVKRSELKAFGVEQVSSP